MLYESNELEMQAVIQTAAQMCAAARTAPKGHGRDTLHTYVLTDKDKDRLADEMEKIGLYEMRDEMPTWYGRDAACLRKAQAVVLIGADKKQRGVPHCGYCDHINCAGCRDAGSNCAWAYVDLGIAASSAVNIASVDKIDCRIMYSVGKAATNMNFVSDVLWLGIPLSVSGKNIFFDRGIFHK